MAEDKAVNVQETEEQANEAEQSAFTASFTDARVDETPAKVETAVEEEQAAEVAAEDDPAQVDEPEVPAEEKAGLSADELTKMLAKLPSLEESGNMTSAEVRKLHGKIGEINRSLLDLQKNGGNKPAVKFTGAQFKRLHAEYPDLAELLAQDFSEAEPAETTEKPAVDTDAFKAEVNTQVAQVKSDLSKEMQHNLLLIQHQDYPKILQSDDFKVWIQTLPEEDRKLMDDTWDAIYLGKKFGEFKDWQSKKTEGTNQRKERLERAILPKGTQKAATPQAQTELDGFNLAFKQ